MSDTNIELFKEGKLQVMSNLVGIVLRQAGLYRPIKRQIRYWTDSKWRKNRGEIREDFKNTALMVNKWSTYGKELSDPKKEILITSISQLPVHVKFHCILAKALQLEGYTPVILTLSHFDLAHKYYKLFGIQHLISWDKYLSRHSISEVEAKELSEKLITPPLEMSKIMKLLYRNVEVGKHALSWTSRTFVSGHLDLDARETVEKFYENLAMSIRNVDAADYLFKNRPIKKLITRDLGYVTFGAIFQKASQHSIDTIAVDQGQRRSTWIFKRFTQENMGQHIFSLSKQSWEQVKSETWTDFDEQALVREFQGRYKPESTDDVRRLMTGKSEKSIEDIREQLELDPNKKTCVIFSHVAWDAAFFYGTSLFDDFEQWLFEVVKFVASECPYTNWIVKLHPFNVFKLAREEGHSEETEMRLLRTLMPLPDHIKIMRANTDISTFSMFPIIDYGLTVNGTIGMELPCFGIPTVIAGTGRYDSYGFTIEPRTKAEYFECLRTLHTIPRLTTEQIRLARRHFLALFTRRQTSFEDIAPMELLRLHEAQRDVFDNISITAKSLDEFRRARSIQEFSKWVLETDKLDLLL